MASPLPRPQLFDVMPAAELQRALRQSLPADTKVVWHQLGAMYVTGGKIGAVDAASLHPQHPGEINTLDWPHPQAEIWLQLAMSPSGQVDRVFAVLVSAPGQGLIQSAGSWEMLEGPTLAIDSATAAIGDYARMLSRMQGGGPASQVCLGRGGSVKEPAAMAAREQAAVLLQQHGYPAQVERWERTGGLSVSIKPGLTDEQIAAANALLTRAGFKDEVWLAGSHTAGLLADALAKSPVTHLSDQHGPYLVACQTGFGDGMYYWDGFVRAGQLCGYVCNFVPADEEAPKQPTDDEEFVELELVNPQPTLPAPSRSTAPAIAPGVLIAVRLPYDTFCIARVEQQLPNGWGVQFVTGERAQVAATSVVPIPGHPVFQVGDEVLALWQGGSMDRGRITAITQQGYTVAWNDGTPPQVVTLGTLTYWGWTE